MQTLMRAKACTHTYPKCQAKQFFQLNALRSLADDIAHVFQKGELPKTSLHVKISSRIHAGRFCALHAPCPITSHTNINCTDGQKSCWLDPAISAEACL